MQIEQDGFPSELLRSIKRIAKKEGYITYEIDKKLLPIDGASFLGDHYMVTIRGKTEDGEKEDNMFVKYRIPGSKLENVMHLAQAYSNEAFVYNELFKIFNELQDEAGIPEEDRFKTTKSYDESSSEALMLDNMTLKGYTSCERTYVASKHVAELSIKQMAKFHALTFAIQEKRPEYNKKLQSIKVPVPFNEEWALSGLNIAKIAAKHIKGEAKKKVDEFIDTQFLDKWKKYLQDTTTTRCCLVHGDVRLNNMLFKYKDGEVTDIIIVDYQIIHYGCPLEDFLFFVFTGTDKQFRKQHLEHLKNFYYEAFSEFLKKLSLDSEDIYPRKDFEKDYKERLDYGLIVSLFFNTYILAAEGQMPDVGGQSAADMQFDMHECFSERIQGIVDDFVSWGYL